MFLVWWIILKFAWRREILVFLSPLIYPHSLHPSFFFHPGKNTFTRKEGIFLCQKILFSWFFLKRINYYLNYANNCHEKLQTKKGFSFFLKQCLRNICLFFKTNSVPSRSPNHYFAKHILLSMVSCHISHCSPFSFIVSYMYHRCSVVIIFKLLLMILKKNYTSVSAFGVIGNKQASSLKWEQLCWGVSWYSWSASLNYTDITHCPVLGCRPQNPLLGFL